MIDWQKTDNEAVDINVTSLPKVNTFFLFKMVIFKVLNALAQWSKTRFDSSFKTTMVH